MGDPHMVTLDGLRYTFNGLGEFVALETTDTSFVLQVRMETLPDAPQGTVATAVAARIGGMDGERVTVTSRQSLSVYVNNLFIDLSSLSMQKFDAFTISREDEVISIQFLNGVYLECRANSTLGLLHAVVVSAPRTFANRIRGLLGNFNGVKGDDLEMLSANSDLSTIHHGFGLTCE